MTRLTWCDPCWCTQCSGTTPWSAPMANLLLLERNQIWISHLASAISILKQLTVAITIALALSSTHLLLASPAFDFTRPSIGNGPACFSPDMGLALMSQIVDPPIRCWFKSLQQLNLLLLPIRGSTYLSRFQNQDWVQRWVMSLDASNGRSLLLLIRGQTRDWQRGGFRFQDQDYVLTCAAQLSSKGKAPGNSKRLFSCARANCRGF